MLTGNKFFKLNSNGDAVRVTTDDIPEGLYNKYNLSYADGKLIGDIILRPSPEEVACHNLLDGQEVYEFSHKDFYALCLEYKNKASEDEDYEFFNKTLEDYEQFLGSNTWEQTNEPYCPYFVIDSKLATVYEVSNEDTIGYTNLPGDVDTEVISGYIYDTPNLQNTIDNFEDWFYTGNSVEVTFNYVKLPTYPTFLNGSTKMYYFIVTNSRVDDNTTSIRSVNIGTTTTLDEEQEAYVKNVGTLQNLILDFGIPRGITASVQIGKVKEGDIPDVVNVGTNSKAIFDFTLPRGPRGNAGAVVILDEIGDTLPMNSEKNKNFYNTTNNTIYVYDGDDWQELEKASMGLIYLCAGNLYYFNGKVLNKTQGIAKVDEETLKLNAEGALEVLGQKTVQGLNTFDWIGTLKQWEKGRSDGTIPDNYVCYITDDFNIQTKVGDVATALDELSGEVI